MKAPAIMVVVTLLVCAAYSQTKDAFGDASSSSESKKLIDPSRLTVSHAMSFGAMSGGGYSSLQSQSFYSTMMQYKFTAPVTLNLNFSLPIHSTMSPYQNLSQANMQSMDYFRNMPFDVSLSWRPSDKFQFNFSVVNYPAYNYGNGMYGSAFMPWYGSPLYR